MAKLKQKIIQLKKFRQGQSNRMGEIGMISCHMPYGHTEPM